MICDHVYQGLTYYIPDSVFALVEHLGRTPCPWCVNDELAKHDVKTQANVQLILSHFHGINDKVNSELESLNHRIYRPIV